MYRRTFLGGLSTFACLAAMPVSASAAPKIDREAAIAGWRKRIRAIQAKGRLPIIDMEATYVPGKTAVGLMIDNMNDLDIAQILFAPAFAPNGAPSLKLFHDHPEYFVPSANSAEFPRWWHDPVAFLKVAARDLDSGNYFAMGEHEFRHLPSPEQVRAGRTDRDIKIPIDGPAGEALFALSERTGVSFQIHYDMFDTLLDALDTMLTRYPKAKVIWCHLGMVRYPDQARRYGPDYVRSMIERHPGLHFDLANPRAEHVYGPSGAREATLFNEDGSVNAAWKAVIEAHPDRFVAASDYRPPVEQFYPEAMKRQRYVLSQLSPTTRERIAYGNGWRLLTGREWQG